jgi:hypothetical protein
MIPTLGRLQRVELRDIWASEAMSFTPWLALPDNLAVLGEALDIELELEAREQSVGPFRADILCKNLADDSWVLIENQLERTDHTHLGQLLTYASGLQAATIVWIAARFTEEHRATLDWLNAITAERFSFFGLEVELWRIGSSPAAPKFNVIAKPNDWSRQVTQGARTLTEGDPTGTQLQQMRFWAAFHAVLNARGGAAAKGSRTPQRSSAIYYAIGVSGLYLAARMNARDHSVSVTLTTSGTRAAGLFSLLKEQRAGIEQELGYALAWSGPDARGICRCGVRLDDVDPTSEADWPRQHDWLAAHLMGMHRVFSARARALDPSGGAQAPDDDVA